jgi:8-oxo-dGTP diphosphatase
MPDGIVLRCSAIVVRQQAVLLIHRTYDGAEDWVLPGGTPHAGESTAACARRQAGHLRGLLGPRRDRYAPYLANLWRPAGRLP